MPDTFAPRQRKVRRLYLVLRDHDISCGVIGALLDVRAKTVRDVLSGHVGFSRSREFRIENFLKWLGIPPEELRDLWTWVPRPDGIRRTPGRSRIGSLKARVAEFRESAVDIDLPSSPDPEPVNLLDVEVPVFTRQPLSVEARKAFDFTDRDGNLVDPFWREFKDPAHGEYGYPGFVRATEALLDAARERMIFALIAPPASGKTFLFERARAALIKKGFMFCEPRLLTKAKITEGTLLNAILAEIAGKDFKPAARIADRCDQIFKALTDEKGMKKVVLAVDEAQELPPLALRCLKRLHDWHYGVFDNLLSIVLIGHPLLKSRLLNDASIQETGRRTVVYELEPLESITEFLSWRLKKLLGFERDSAELFTADGLLAFENLLGRRNDPHRDWRPFIVSSLASRALEETYKLGERQITEAIIRRLANAEMEG